MALKISNRNLIGILSFLTFATLVCLLAACSASTPHPTASDAKLPTGSTQLTGAGATFPSLLYNRWFTVYHDAHPTTFIKYAAVGSGEGVRRFIGSNVRDEEKIDFGASDFAMSDAELAQANNDTLLLPATAGCVVLAYNLPTLRTDLKLSRRAYAGIFLGEIKNWNDPLIAQSNPGVKLPNISVVTAVREDNSGTTAAFTRNLDAINDRWHGRFGVASFVDWPGSAMRAKGNEGVAGLVEKSVGSIGYVGFEFARRLGLDTAQLENQEGVYVKASEQSCSKALATAEIPDNFRAFVPDPKGPDSYPIVTLSWILLRKGYKDPQTAAALRDFFAWCLQDGQRYASQLGYVPIPSPLAQKAVSALDTLSASR